LKTVYILIVYGIGILLTGLGFLLFFKTDWMLKFTEFFEGLIGVIWIPSEKTEKIYKIAGLFFISLGCAYLGYIFGMR
jgi:hypothetical protein